MPAKTTCLCGNPVADSAYLCIRCSKKLWKALTEVPDVLNDLETTRTRQSRIGSSNVGVTSRSASKPLPWDQKAREAYFVLRSVLVFRARIVLRAAGPRLHGPACQDCVHLSCAARRNGDGPADNLHAVARWLRDSHLEWFRHHQDAPDFLDELSDALRNARRVIDRAPDTWYAGTCGHSEPAVEGGSVVCSQELYGKDGEHEVRCPTCTTVYVAAERRAWLLTKAEDQLATTSVLSGAVSRLGHPVTPLMIDGYVRRGRLMPHGVNQHGHRLFRVGDLLDLLHSKPAPKAKPEPRRKARTS